LESERLLRKLRRKKLLPKSTDTKGIESERETVRSSFKRKRYSSADTNDFEFDDSETGSTAEPFSPPVSDIRWSGTSLADSRSFDDVLSADEGIRANKQKGDGISIGFIAALVFGGLVFLLLTITFFVLAW